MRIPWVPDEDGINMRPTRLEAWNTTDRCDRPWISENIDCLLNCKTGVLTLVTAVVVFCTVDRRCLVIGRQTRHVLGIFDDCSMTHYEPEIRLVSRDTGVSCSTPVTVRISMPRVRDVMVDVVEYAMNGSIKRFYLPHSARVTKKGVGLKGIEVLVDQDGDVEPVDVFYVTCASTGTHCRQSVRLPPVGSVNDGDHQDLTYHVSSRSPAQNPVRRLGIVAAFNDTSIEIEFPSPKATVQQNDAVDEEARRPAAKVFVGGKLYGSDEIFRITLDAYETLALGELVDDLSGTVVRSSRPLSVVAVVTVRDQLNRSVPVKSQIRSDNDELTVTDNSGTMAGLLRGRLVDVTNNSTSTRPLNVNDNESLLHPPRGRSDQRYGADHVMHEQPMIVEDSPQNDNSSLIDSPSKSSLLSSLLSVTADHSPDVGFTDVEMKAERTECSNCSYPSNKHRRRSGSCSSSSGYQAENGSAAWDTIVVLSATERCRSTYLLVADEDFEWFRLIAVSTNCTARLEIVRGTVSNDATLSWGHHHDLYVSRSEAVVVHSDEPLFVLPLSTRSCKENEDSIDGETVAALKPELALQTLKYTNWWSSDAANRMSATLWLLVNRSRIAQGQSMLHLGRLVLPLADGMDNFNILNETNLTSSAMSVAIDEHVIELFRLKLVTGSYVISRNPGPDTSDKACTFVRVYLADLDRDNYDNNSSHCRLWNHHVTSCRGTADHNARCRAKIAVRTGTLEKDELVTRSKSSTIIASSRPIAERKVAIRAAMASGMLFGSVYQRDKRKPSESDSHDELVGLPLPVTSSAPTSSNVDTFLSYRNKRFSSSDAVESVVSPAEHRRPQQQQQRPQRRPINASSSSSSSSSTKARARDERYRLTTPTSSLLAATSTDSSVSRGWSSTTVTVADQSTSPKPDDVPYIVRGVDGEPTRVVGGGVVVVKVTDERRRNETVLPPSTLADDDADVARWHVSPTVLAVLASLASAGFFVVACIGGFVVADFVCGGDRRGGGARNIDQRARLLAGARRRVSAKVSPYFVD